MTNLFSPIKPIVFKILSLLIWIPLIIICSPIIFIFILSFIFYYYFIEEQPLVEILRSLFFDDDRQFVI